MLVGDSLRGSLRAQVLNQLGWIDQTLVGSRLFSDIVVSRKGENPLGQHSVYRTIPGGWTSSWIGVVPAVVPALLLQGTANSTSSAGENSKPTHARSRVTIVGVDRFFWHDLKPDEAGFWDSTDPVVVLSANLGRDLQVQAGDTIALHFPKAGQMPRETLLGRRDASDVVDELRSGSLQ